MKRITLLLSFTIALACTHAIAAYKSGPYLGIQVSQAALGGERSDSAVMGASKPQLSMGEKLGSNKVEGSLIAGYLYCCSKNNFACALETSGTYGSLTETHNSNVASVAYQITIERLWNLGLYAKPGFIVRDNYFVYALIGADISEFRQNVIQTASGMMGNVDSREKKSKTLAGLSFGAGIETDLDPIRLGIEIKNTAYTKDCIISNNRYPVTTEINPNIFSIGLRAVYAF